MGCACGVYADVQASCSQQIDLPMSLHVTLHAHRQCNKQKLVPLKHAPQQGSKTGVYTQGGGVHGNALLSKFDMSDARLIRHR